MPPQTASKPCLREDGTASVELVAVIPFLLLAVLVAAQIALAGHALWSASVAARAGARAALIRRDGGPVAIRKRVPVLIPGLPKISVTARTSLGSGDD